MAKLKVSWVPDDETGETPDPLVEVPDHVMEYPADGEDAVSEWLSRATGFLVYGWTEVRA